MSNIFVIYPPGAGGNHLKNLLCLSKSFINHTELDTSVYDDQHRIPGEVWCVGGRNFQDIFFDRIQNNPGSSSILIGHFGELMQHREQFAQVPDIRLIVISIATAHARRQLDQRQLRLGQTIHPYWLDEELIWCYHLDMFQRYFGLPREHCLEVAMEDFWHPNMISHGLLDHVCRFSQIEVDHQQAQVLHDKWHAANFGQSMTFDK